MFLGTISLRSIAGLAVLLLALANLLLAGDLLDGGRIVDSTLTAAFPLVAAALVVERLWATSEQGGTLRVWETSWWTLLLEPWAAWCWSPNPC